MVEVIDPVEGLTEEDRSIPLGRLPAALWALAAVLTVAPVAVFVLVHGWRPFVHLGATSVLWLIALTLAHELTHAVAWKVAGRLPWRAFTFGFSWKALAPYCHSREAMPVRAYRIGALMPLVFTGLLPWGIGLLAGSVELGLAGAVLIGGAAGDLWVHSTLRDLPNGTLVKDHPANAGCIVFRP